MYYRLQTLVGMVLLGAALVGCSTTQSEIKLVASVSEVHEEGSLTLSLEGNRGDINRVEFFQGEQKLGEDAASPFVQNVELRLADNGNQSFVAKTTFGDGSQTVSTATVKVDIYYVQGHVYQTTRSGGNPLAGAKVYLNFGDIKTTTLSDVDGSFSIPVKGQPWGFDLTVVPPVGSSYFPINYDSVPLAAYLSSLGSSRDLNIYMPGGPQALNPVYSARWGCLQGQLLDSDGTPALGQRLPGTNSPNRTSPAACNGSSPSGLSLDAVPLKPGETGLITYRGLQGVMSGSGGNFLMPVISRFNSFATEGFVWAGNYDSIAAGGTEFYWSKFAYIPQVKAFLNGGQISPVNLKLESFDPATNPKIFSYPLSHDTGALSGGGFDFDPATGNAVSLTNARFESSVTSGDILLGRYLDFTTPHKLRLFKIPDGKQGQTISLESQALEFDNKGNLLAYSVVQQWLNGTSQGKPGLADFMSVPVLQSPALGATGVSRTPRLVWKPVNRPALYSVTLYDGDTGAPVWATITNETFLNLYQVPLEANKIYFWDVGAEENIQMIDVVAAGPEVLQANRFVDTDNLNSYGKQRFKSNPVNDWRGSLVKTFLQTQGYVPKTSDLGSKFGVNLIESGFRFSNSEISVFETGN